MLWYYYFLMNFVDNGILDNGRLWQANTNTYLYAVSVVAAVAFIIILTIAVAFLKKKKPVKPHATLKKRITLLALVGIYAERLSLFVFQTSMNLLIEVSKFLNTCECLSTIASALHVFKYMYLCTQWCICKLFLGGWFMLR